MTDRSQKSTDSPDDFADQSEPPRIGIVREFWDFLRNNKRWWLTPIVVVLLLLSLLVVLGGGPAGAFLYTFF